MAVAEPRRIQLVRVRVFVMLTVALALVASPAFGWSIVKSTNGVVLDRESGDSTATVTVTVRYDYKGGNSYSPSYPYSAASFNASTPAMYLGEHVDSVELDLVDGYRIQYVGLTVGSVTRAFVVINEPMQVAVESSVPIAIDSTVTVGQVSITPTSTVGLAEGTEVGVSSVGSLDDFSLTYLGGIAAVGLGIAVGKWARGHSW